MNQTTEMSFKHCLLKDLPDTDMFHSIYEYIKSLPKEMRATPDIQQQRLDVCIKCENLINGLCALCGCFVEIRAAKAELHCPQGSDIW